MRRVRLVGINDLDQCTANNNSICYFRYRRSRTCVTDTESDAYWYVRSDLVDEWEVSLDELHDIALENLDTYFTENSMELMLTGEPEGPQLLLPHRPDAYNSARLLSEPFHVSLQATLGRELIVGIPNRDFFVAVSLDSEEVIAKVRRKVIEDYDRMDHPLSKRLLLVSTDGVSEYCDEDDVNEE